MNLREELPKSDGTFSGAIHSVGDMFSTPLKAGFVTPYASLFSSERYDKHFGKFAEIRDGYVDKIVSLIRSVIDDIVRQLEGKRVYIDSDDLFVKILSDSFITENLNKCVASYHVHSDGYLAHCAEFVAEMQNQTEVEGYDMLNSGRVRASVYKYLLAPLTDYFLAMINSSEIGDIIPSTTESVDVIRSSYPGAAKKIGNRLFKRKDIKRL